MKPFYGFALVAGFVSSLITIGLFIYQFRLEIRPALPIAGLVLAAILFATFLYITIIYWKEQAAFYLIREHKDIVTIEGDGQYARVKKRLRVVANVRGLTLFTIRDISASGDLHSFEGKFNGALCPTNVKRVAGDYHVTLELPRPLQRREVAEIEVSFDAMNCFSQPEEDYGALTNFPTDKRILEIQFKGNRTFKEDSVRLYEFYGGDLIEHRKGLTIHPRTITVEIDKATIGSEWQVRWTW